MTHAGGMTGTSAQDLFNMQAMMYQNPTMMQQLLWMSLQQQPQPHGDQVGIKWALNRVWWALFGGVLRVQLECC